MIIGNAHYHILKT